MSNGVQNIHVKCSTTQPDACMYYLRITYLRTLGHALNPPKDMIQAKRDSLMHHLSVKFLTLLSGKNVRGHHTVKLLRLGGDNK